MDEPMKYGRDMNNTPPLVQESHTARLNNAYEQTATNFYARSLDSVSGPMPEERESWKHRKRIKKKSSPRFRKRDTPPYR